MKRLLVLLLSLFMAAGVHAQSEIDSGFLYVQGYEGTSLLLIMKQNLKIQRGDQVDSFRIKTDKGVLRLQIPKDTMRIYDLLGIGIQDLQSQGVSSFETLLNRVNRLKDKKIVFKSDTGVDSTQNEGAQMMPQGISTASDNGFSTTTVGLLGAGALLIGFLLGWLLKANKKVGVNTKEISNGHQAAVSMQSNSENQQLKALLLQKQKENETLKNNYNQIFSQDKAIYDALLTQIVIPLQTALNQNNEAELVKYMTLAMSYMSSITKSKLGKKHDFDEANVRLLLGNQASISKFPVVTGQTPIDRIPASLRLLISFLKRYGIKGVDQVVINGYVLKDL